MLDLHPSEMISGMRQWWRNWRRAHSNLSELMCCGEYEAERMARDLGLPLSELRRLAGYGPEAADLLAHRMAALNIDMRKVTTVVPRTFQDLQRTCTMCETRRQCARDLGRDPANQAWEDYCPNAAMLKMLTALPWAARGTRGNTSDH